jgi:hypothetical protein
VPRTQIDYENLMTGIRSVKPDYKPKYRVHEDGEKFYRHSIYIWTVRPVTQRPRIDLNERFLPRPNTTTA